MGGAYIGGTPSSLDGFCSGNPLKVDENWGYPMTQGTNKEAVLTLIPALSKELPMFFMKFPCVIILDYNSPYISL